MISNISIIALSFAGLWIALYIRSHKTQGSTLVCPIGHTCDPVIHSGYSKFMGIPVEFLGILYYALVLATYTTITFAPQFAHELIAQEVAAVSIIAFIFSIYLTAVQAFVLKQWCTWCLFSASFCATIFLIVVL